MRAPASLPARRCAEAGDTRVESRHPSSWSGIAIAAVSGCLNPITGVETTEDTEELREGILGPGQCLAAGSVNQAFSFPCPPCLPWFPTSKLGLSRPGPPPRKQKGGTPRGIPPSQNFRRLTPAASSSGTSRPSSRSHRASAPCGARWRRPARSPSHPW